MIILGIDPGSRITGFGLVEEKGGHLAHIENGLILLPASRSSPEKLALLFRDMQKLIERYHPGVVSVENVFYSKNIKSTLKLGEARGMALLAASLGAVPVVEYAARAVKQAVAGYGAAPKEQIQRTVRSLLRLPEIPEENAADALALAICHAHSCKWQEKIAGSF